MLLSSKFFCHRNAVVIPGYERGPATPDGPDEVEPIGISIYVYVQRANLKGMCHQIRICTLNICVEWRQVQILSSYWVKVFFSPHNWMTTWTRCVFGRNGMEACSSIQQSGMYPQQLLIWQKNAQSQIQYYTCSVAWICFGALAGKPSNYTTLRSI